MSTLGQTLSHRVLPQKNLSVLSDTFLILTGSLFMGILAQLSVPLPFTPVPITGQTLGVVLVGAALGWRRGAMSMALYLLEGSIGLPVFAGGAFGFHHLLGPGGGYLAGFVVAAAFVGFFAERGLDRSWKTAFPLFLGGELLVFAVGLPWLAIYMGWDKALITGFWPFLPGAFIKAIVAAGTLPSAWKFVSAFKA